MAEDKVIIPKEVHLFIIWEHGRRAEDKILKDIKDKFNILKIYEIIWSKDKFTENLSRFYGTNLPPDSNKEKHCGTGPFLAIIVEDKKPVYKMQATSSGEKYINTNLFNAKTRHREWTGGGHRVHGSNTVVEADHNLTLLFGKNAKDLLRSIKLGDEKYEKFKNDPVGVNGWESLEQLFYVLNSTINYVVLRNFEPLPEKYYAGKHGDIDLLVSNYKDACFITNARPIYKASYRVYSSVSIKGEEVFFDFRFIGDNYYDAKWQQVILEERELSPKGFYKPSPENHFYSLLYHALIQKPAVSKDYINKLSQLGKTFRIKLDEQSFASGQALEILSKFLVKKDYAFTMSQDKSVYTNIDNVKTAMKKYRLKFSKKNRIPLRNHLKKSKAKAKHYSAKLKRIVRGQINKLQSGR